MPKKPKKLEKVYDKYWDENRPGFDYEYMEQLVAPEDMDEVVQAQSERFGLLQELDPSDFLPDRKKQEELLNQTYETAAKVLTNPQYRVFIMRYMFGLKETDIAKQMNISQAYVAAMLPRIHYKIRKALQLEPPRRRKKTTQKRKNTPKTRTKKNLRFRTKKSLKS